MTDDELRHQIYDALSGRGQFADPGPYSPMGSPLGDTLFFNYFGTLSDEDKGRGIRLLADMESGRDPDTPDSQHAAHFLMALAVTHPPRFAAVRGQLEQDFTDPANLQHWASAADQGATSHANYTKGFERAIMLYAILVRLGPERVEAAWQYLIQNAQSERLRQVLHLNKSMAGMNLKDGAITYTDYSNPDAPRARRFPR